MLEKVWKRHIPPHPKQEPITFQVLEEIRGYIRSLEKTTITNVNKSTIELRLDPANGEKSSTTIAPSKSVEFPRSKISGKHILWRIQDN